MRKNETHDWIHLFLAGNRYDHHAVYPKCNFCFILDYTAAVFIVLFVL